MKKSIMTIASLKSICVDPNGSIRQAIQVLNDGHQRIALVVDDDQKLRGVIADGDVRRAILEGIPLDGCITDIMVRTPATVEEHMDDGAVLSMMQSMKIYELPVVNGAGQVLGLKTIDSLMADQKQTCAVVVAGGLGTRLHPLTHEVPKPLVTVGGKPILFALLDQLILCGIRRITLALNYKAEMIRQAISAVPTYARIVDYVEERQRLGTAGPISLLPEVPEESFLVMNADLMTTVDFNAMLQFHEQEQNSVTMAIREEKTKVPYGVVQLEGTTVRDIEEKPVRTDFVNAGIYVLQPDVVLAIPVGEYFDMPDLIKEVIGSGKKVGSFPVHEYWVDIGGRQELERARRDHDALFGS